MPGASAPAGWGAPAPTGWGAGAAPGAQPPAGWQQLTTGSPAPYGAVLTRRGIIALKPLGFGDFFDGAFRAIRHNPRVMIGVTAIVVAVTTVLVTVPYGGLLAGVGLDSEGEFSSGDVALLIGSLGGLLVAGLLQSAGLIVLNGLLMLSVSQSVLDRRLSFSELWHRAKGRLLPLIGQALLLSLGAGVLLTAAVAPGTALLVVGEIAAGVVAILVFFFVVLVGFVFLSIVWLLAPAVLVIERSGVFSSLGRSFRLVRGAFWKTLFVYLLAVILTSVAAQVVSLPVGIGAGVIGALFPDNVTVFAISQAIGVTLSSVIGSIVAVPFLAAVVALLYVDRRIRLEGLDVVLTRAFGEEQAAGGAQGQPA